MITDTIYLATTEFKFLLRSKAKQRSLAIALLLPLVFGFLALWAFWDPYGQDNSLPIAVVNFDLGYTAGSTYINTGEEVINALKNSKSLNVKEPTLSEANRQLEDGTIEAIIIVPDGFTFKFLQHDLEDKPKLNYQSRNGASFFGSSLVLERVRSSLGSARFIFYDLSSTAPHNVLSLEGASLIDIRDASGYAPELYGPRLASLFLQISLWMGAVMLLYALPPKDPRLAVSRFSTFSITASKSIVLAFFGALQALLLDISLLSFLNLDIASPVLFILFTILLSWVFIAITQVFFLLLGRGGQLISVMLLMLQISASGALFPLKASPLFFQVFSPFLPMTYGTTGLNELILAKHTGTLIPLLLPLFFFLLLFYLLRILYTKRQISAKEAYPLH